MKPEPTRTRLGALAATTVVAASSALAADYTWQVAGTNNLWSTAGTDTNWFVGGVGPLAAWADGNAAILDDAAGEAITLTGTVAPTSTTVNNNGTWTLGGTGVRSRFRTPPPTPSAAAPPSMAASSRSAPEAPPRTPPRSGPWAAA